MGVDRSPAFIVLCCSFFSIGYVLTILSQLTLVEGFYILQAQIHGYANPNQRRFTGCNRFGCFSACCDNGDGACTSGGRRCDTFFLFCLRPFNSTIGCDSNRDIVMQSDDNINDGNIDLSQGTFLGLSNPLIFQGLTNSWNGIRLDITVEDRDGSGSQLIDIIVIDIPVSSLDTPTDSIMHQGRAGITEIVINITVFCAQNFQGSNCIQCISGFTGAMCDVNINDCEGVTCSGNGQCVDGLNTFTCECNPGFIGTTCDEIDDCLGETCSGNGQCVDGLNTFTCNCNLGFTGANCMGNINECVDPGICNGNGQCVDEVGSYSCNCSAGYTGTTCDTNIDDCTPNPCGANGQCIDGVDSFTCDCNIGYTGVLCERDIDECLSNPCDINGMCMNQEGSFGCICDPGFTGELCKINIDECVGVNCSGKGNCSDGIGSFRCSCISGYTGILCDMDINDCLSNPCGTNGQCMDGVNTFNCSCDSGFTGELCQTNIDDCEGVNCSGNGVCVDGVNSFTCQELQSSGVQTGPIVGGVLGALISLILILVIVVAVVLTMRCQNRQGKEGIHGRTAHSDALPGDNPVYERGNTAVTLGAQSSVPVQYVNLSSNDRANMAGSTPDRVFDNPIYGGNDEETEDMYADPDANHHAGTGMGSAPYHEFDNPIYGGEPDENAYSLLADSSTVNDTAASNGQMTFTNSKRGALVIGNEQAYDDVDY